MAKRKRLTPAHADFLSSQGGEREANPFAGAAPIAGVARETSSAAALEEMAETLSRARREGRMVLPLPLDQIETEYLVRDRLAVDAEDLHALKESLRNRGQQTPIEVADLGQGRYGLISGWRRCRALAELHAETGQARFAEVMALLRHPEDASEAYLAMVEENEIRVGLSYYERARIAAKAVEQGVFPDRQAALRGLFHAASRGKRSKIGSFLDIVAALDGALRFPQAIGERQGLALAKALSADPALSDRLRADLAAAETQEAEQTLLGEALARGEKSPRLSRRETPQHRDLGAGLAWRESPDRLTLSGPALTPELRARLEAWLKSQI